MATLFIVLHIIVSIALIVIVLLQGGKGAEIGASFGAGASQTVFGATGGQSFIQKLTTSAAVIFMLTSLILAYFHGQPGGSSVMPESVGTPAPSAAPVATPAAPVEPAKESTAPVPAETEKK